MFLDVARFVEQTHCSLRNDKGKMTPALRRRPLFFAPTVSLLALLLTAFTPEYADAGKKVKRVKAGTTYKTHDPVHIVVNKVG